GIDLFHLLGDQAKLCDGSRFKLVHVTEGHRFERKDRFACLVHRFDRVLETLRGDHRAEMAAGINNDPDTLRNGYSTNADDICVRLSSCRANADRIGVTRSTGVADLDIVVAIEKSSPGVKAQCNVVAAGRKVKERVNTVGRVAAPDRVASERTKTIGRVVAAGRVACKRQKTSGRVEKA